MPHKEVFYGGAAGGGKSDALLMAALQYVDIPGYSALIVRKTLADAKKPNSILYRAKEWLKHTDARWSSEEHAYYFPAGAILKFGKLANVGDAFDYLGSEYQFEGFDELTHFYEADFEYVTSRMRKTKCPYHKDKIDRGCPTCLEFAALSKVPLRIRTASNPGGKGHIWVKRRYDIGLVPGKTAPSGRPLYMGRNKKRPHIPAFIHDNPFLDQTEYEEQLKSISDPVTREQLLSGDWGVSEEGRFKQHWMKFYVQDGSWLTTSQKTWNEQELQTFMMIDPAASSASTPGTKELTKKIASHTAGGVFSLTPHGDLLVREVFRHQKEAPYTKHMIREKLAKWDCLFVGMELSVLSTHMIQMLRTEGFNIRPFPHKGQDKIARSVKAANLLESGKVYLPEVASDWKQEFEDEIYVWQGLKEETDDQVDIFSYAGIHAHSKRSGSTAAPVVVM